MIRFSRLVDYSGYSGEPLSLFTHQHNEKQKNMKKLK